MSFPIFSQIYCSRISNSKYYFPLLLNWVLIIKYNTNYTKSKISIIFQTYFTHSGKGRVISVPTINNYLKSSPNMSLFLFVVVIDKTKNIYKTNTFVLYFKNIQMFLKY